MKARTSTAMAATTHRSRQRAAAVSASPLLKSLAVIVSQGRGSIEYAITALIDVLDVADSDPDLERDDEDADEFQDGPIPAVSRAGPGEEEDAEPNGDAEPSLGSSEVHVGVYGPDADQTHWAGGGTDDRECDGDDREFSAQPTTGASHGALAPHEVAAIEDDIVAKARQKVRRRSISAGKVMPCRGGLPVAVHLDHRGRPGQWRPVR